MCEPIFTDQGDDREDAISADWKDKKIVYIAGPYRADTINGIYHNIHEARRRMEWVWKQGNVPICPHTNSAFIDGIVEDTVILSSYLRLLSVCNAILLIQGWEESSGATTEFKVAIELGLQTISDPFASIGGVN